MALQEFHDPESALETLFLQGNSESFEITDCSAGPNDFVVCTGLVKLYMVSYCADALGFQVLWAMPFAFLDLTELPK